LTIEVEHFFEEASLADACSRIRRDREASRTAGLPLAQLQRIAVPKSCTAESCAAGSTFERK